MLLRQPGVAAVLANLVSLVGAETISWIFAPLVSDFFV